MVYQVDGTLLVPAAEPATPACPGLDHDLVSQQLAEEHDGGFEVLPGRIVPGDGPDHLVDLVDASVTYFIAQAAAKIEGAPA